jgi:hypothetical protein
MEKYFGLYSKNGKKKAVASLKSDEDKNYLVKLSQLDANLVVPFNLYYRNISFTNQGTFLSDNLDELEIYTDYVLNSAQLPIFSAKMRNIITEFELYQQELAEWLSINIFANNEKREYYILRIRNPIDSLDTENSVFVNNDPLNTVMIPIYSYSKIKELPFFPSVNTNFQIPSSIVICERLKKLFQKEKLNGISYENVIVR